MIAMKRLSWIIQMDPEPYLYKGGRGKLALEEVMWQYLIEI